MDTIELDISEQNELTFKIQVEGADGAPAKVRMLFEGDDMAYAFDAKATTEVDVFSFIVPVMEKRIKPGSYKAQVEVVVENKYFSPMQFDVMFKQPVKVVAEAVSVGTLLPSKVETKVDITPIAVKQLKSSSGQQVNPKRSLTLKEKFKKNG